jgi:hypothetical protein
VCSVAWRKHRHLRARAIAIPPRTPLATAPSRPGTTCGVGSARRSTTRNAATPAVRVAVLTLTAALFVVLAGPMHPAAGEAAVVKRQRGGLFVKDDKPWFPISVSNGPPDQSAWPQLQAAGVNMLRFDPGPLHPPHLPPQYLWDTAMINKAHQFDLDAEANGLFTWVKLNEAAAFDPGSRFEAIQAQIIQALGDDPAVAFWKGVDEPNVAPRHRHKKAVRMRYAYAQAMRLDERRHPWVTIESSGGHAPPAWVGTQGVDVNPIGYRSRDPNLAIVGEAARRFHAHFITIGVCDSRSSGPNGFKVADRQQMRFMAYDAIINGARALNFYGSQAPNCWTPDDQLQGWGWSEWNSAVRPVVDELAHGRIAPLLTARRGGHVHVSHVEVTSRRVGQTLWAITANPTNRTVKNRIRFPHGAVRRHTYTPWQVKIYKQHD